MCSRLQGSCIGAGYSDCCQDSNCLGDVGDCYCDEYCFSLNDCCTDTKDICSIGKSLDLLTTISLSYIDTLVSFMLLC